jgi:MtN3 and saliva related transmembrane protein
MAIHIDLMYHNYRRYSFISCFGVGDVLMVDWFTWFVEVVFGLGMFINALLFIPQAIKIYKTKSSEGVSATTFVGFNLIQVFTILHGYIHGDWMLAGGYVLSLLISGATTYLVFLYRKDGV